MATTLQTYGFDSYPYLHVSRRRCIPYADVLAYAVAMDKGLPPPKGLDPISVCAVADAWLEEQLRRLK